MEQHHRGSAGCHGLPENLARMDDAGVERADREHGTPQDAVLGVEQQHAELFDAAIAELRQQVLGDDARARHLRARYRRLAYRPAAKLHRGENLRGPGRSDAADTGKVVERRARQAGDTAERRENAVGEIESARARPALTDNDRDELIVAERVRTAPRKLFTRSIVLGNGLHRTPSLLYCRAMRRRVAVAICTLLVLTGCSEAPQKEIDRAQGAIDAARAAGAEQYAPEPFTAATTAMQQTHEAVQQRDYRLALSRAVDANERALEAVRQAADGKARAQSDADAAITRAAIALRQLEERLKVADTMKLPARDVDAARKSRVSAERAVQEARAAVAVSDYARVRARVGGLPEKIAAEIHTLNAAIDARSGRGARRRR